MNIKKSKPVKLDQMNELEKEIFEEVKKIIPKASEAINSTEITTRFIEFPFQCFGVIDRLTYDQDKKAFTKITYEVGIGSPSFVSKFMPQSGFYDETEIRTLEINIPLE